MSGAALINENQPFAIAASPGRSSLLLPDRATATTAPMCATLDYPSMRFFAAAAGSGKAKLTIEMLTVDAKGKTKSKGIAKIEPGSSWQPTVCWYSKSCWRRSFSPVKRRRSRFGLAPRAQ
jgi:hypothetical protein